LRLPCGAPLLFVSTRSSRAQRATVAYRRARCRLVAARAAGRAVSWCGRRAPTGSPSPCFLRCLLDLDPCLVPRPPPAPMLSMSSLYGTLRLPPAAAALCRRPPDSAPLAPKSRARAPLGKRGRSGPSMLVQAARSRALSASCGFRVGSGTRRVRPLRPLRLVRQVGNSFSPSGSPSWRGTVVGHLWLRARLPRPCFKRRLLPTFPRPATPLPSCPPFPVRVPGRPCGLAGLSRSWSWSAPRRHVRPSSRAFATGIHPALLSCHSRSWPPSRPLLSWPPRPPT